MPDKSTTSDAPQLSRRSKFLHILRRIYSSRPLAHILSKKKLNHSHSRRQDNPDTIAVPGDTSRQHHSLAYSSSSSPEDFFPTPISQTKIQKKDCPSVNDGVKICAENDTLYSDARQSLTDNNMILPRENSFIQETTNHLSTKMISSESSENYFPTQVRDMAITELYTRQKYFNFWTEIPHEVALSIFSYLTPKELVRVSIVSRRFHNFCYDGQLWTSFDASNFYKDISAESLAKIIVAAGPFVKTLNLRGCIQVEHYKRAEIVVKACNNLINTTLEGCRNFQRSTLHSLLMGNINLVKLNLTGLTAVTNGTCKIIGHTCSRLESLDVSGCTRMDARGIRMIVQGCRMLKDLRTREIKGMDCLELAQDIFEANGLERLVFSGCFDLSDEALQMMIHGKDPEIDILTNVPLVPIRNLRYLDISRCYRISDFGIKALANLTSNLQGLLLSGCSHISNQGLKDVVTSIPHLTRLDLEEVSYLTNDFFKETLAKASCALTLKHLSVSCCDQVGDPGMIPIFRTCKNLESVELDNTDISDLVLSEAANMLRSRCKSKTGQKSNDIIIGLHLVVYDCQNVTWAGIREVMCRNSDVPKFTIEEIPPQITEIISLKCSFPWQMTIDEHTKRLLKGDLPAAHRLERLWTDWIIANEEHIAHGAGIRRRRRRRVRETRVVQGTEERDDRNRQRARLNLNTSGCSIM